MVLPAPLGPRMPTRLPGGRSRSMSRSAGARPGCRTPARSSRKCPVRASRWPGRGCGRAEDGPHPGGGRADLRHAPGRADQRENDLERREGGQGQCRGPRRRRVAEKADGDGRGQLDEHSGGGDQGGPARGAPLAVGDRVDDAGRPGVVLGQRPGGDELPVPGDEFDGAFGQFGALRGAFPGCFTGDADDQPRQHHAGNDQPARERDGRSCRCGGGDGDGGTPGECCHPGGQQPPQDGVLQSVHIGHEPGDEVPAGVPRAGHEGLVDASAKGTEPPQDDFVPGEPLGVPEATAEQSEGPDGHDGDGERGERRPFGGPQQQPGGGGQQSEGGELGAGPEERGAEEPAEVLCGHAPASQRSPHPSRGASPIPAYRHRAANPDRSAICGQLRPCGWRT